MANVLPREKQIAVIAALCEGGAHPATERLTGVNRETVMKLGARVGMGCAKVHGRLMRDLNVSRLEFDEIWQFVGKKRKAVPRGDPATVAINIRSWRWAGHPRRLSPTTPASAPMKPLGPCERRSRAGARCSGNFHGRPQRLSCGD